MVDHTGEKFNRLFVVKLHHKEAIKNGTKIYWECLCDCGKFVVMRADRLKKSKSCGCLAIELSTKHGMHTTPEYRTWAAIHQRCENPKSGHWEYYGKRGIQVCARWDSFDNFFKDMGRRPAGNYSINRKDNDGPYSPDNCHWATPKAQQNNRSTTPFLTYKGETKPLTEWATALGIPRDRLYVRICIHGWSVEKAFNTGTRMYNRKQKAGVS